MTEGSLLQTSQWSFDLNGHITATEKIVILLDIFCFREKCVCSIRVINIGKYCFHNKKDVSLLAAQWCPCCSSLLDLLTFSNRSALYKWELKKMTSLPSAPSEVINWVPFIKASPWIMDEQNMVSAETLKILVLVKGKWKNNTMNNVPP